MYMYTMNKVRTCRCCVLVSGVPVSFEDLEDPEFANNLQVHVHVCMCKYIVSVLVAYILWC